MGNPIVELRDLYFVRFMDEPCLDGLPDYASRFEGTLKGRYDILGMNTAHMIERFQALLRNDEMRVLCARYAFDGEGTDFCEEWKVRFYRTQIPHIDGGANRKPPGDGVEMELAYSMVREGLADVVGHAQEQVGKRTGSVFRRADSLPRITRIGTVSGIYVDEKVRSIHSLAMKKNWEIHREDGFTFSEFWRSISRVLGGENPRAVVMLVDEGRRVKELPG